MAWLFALGIIWLCLIHEGFWLFALGLIWLCLIHEGFRKVVFWTAGISFGLLIVIELIVAAGN